MSLVKGNKNICVFDSDEREREGETREIVVFVVEYSYSNFYSL
jgi:hypothetical protein